MSKDTFDFDNQPGFRYTNFGRDEILGAIRALGLDPGWVREVHIYPKKVSVTAFVRSDEWGARVLPINGLKDVQNNGGYLKHTYELSIRNENGDSK